ncbi:MAG: WD40/YVTN/BNR-like repeat-containing protein [Thermoanaerobaculia bacterium]
MPRPLRLAILLAFGLALTSPALAGINRWTSHGPEGGGVGTLAFDPTSPGILYVGSSGAFKSYNRGASWFEMAFGGKGVLIEADPVSHLTLHALTADSYFKSTDGGSSWRPIRIGVSTRIGYGRMAVAAPPGGLDSVLYAIAEGVGTFKNDVWKSTDSGETWTPTHFDGVIYGRVVYRIATAPDGRYVFAIAYPDQAPDSVYRSIDGGSSWQPVGDPRMHETSVIVVHPRRPSTVYAAAIGNAGTDVFRSDDGGQTWTGPPGTPAIPERVYDTLALDPENPQVALAGTQTGVYRTENGGATWARIEGLAVDVVVLRFDPAGSSRVYAGTRTSSGVLRSADGGRTWIRANHGLNKGLVFGPDYVVGLAGGSQPAERLYARMYTCALTRSDDSGRTWPCISQQASVLAVDTKDSATVYGRDEVTYGLMKSTDGGIHFQPVNTGDIGFVSALLLDPADPSKLFAQGVLGISRSIDHGATWTPTSAVRVPNELRVTLLAVGGPPTALYYSSEVCTSYGSLYCTGSQTFFWRLEDNGIISAINRPPGFYDITAATWAADPWNPGALLVGKGSLQRSADGLTWTPVAGGPATVHSIVFDRVHAGRVYASGDNGVWASADSGASWSPMNEGLEGHIVDFLLLGDNRTPLHAAVRDGGVYTFEIGTETAVLSPAPDRPFSVTLAVRDPRTGHTAQGLTAQRSGDYAYFVFPDITRDSENPEVFVKAVDGRPVNGSIWFFYGGLTDLEYTLTVTELATGRSRTYVKPAYGFCGGADTEAFPTAPGASRTVATTGAPAATQPAAGCPPDALCLSPGRDFALLLTARDQRTGRITTGVPAALLDSFGYFSLPAFTGNPSNPEVFVKILDATPLDGRYWLFFGGLTDLEYTLTVIDVATGGARVYSKPAGESCGGFDSFAFPLP